MTFITGRPTKTSKLTKRPPPKQRSRLHGYRSWQSHAGEFQRYLQAHAEPMHQDCWGLFHEPELLSNAAKRQQVEVPRHLFALEVADLLEFTAADLTDAWKHRSECCGSVEVAAELYALYRVLSGIDEYYAGEAAYLWHPDVQALFPGRELLQQGEREELGELSREATDGVIAGAGVYDLEAVRKLGIDALRKAWANRPDSFASLEAAAETLAILRSLKNESSTKPTYRTLLDHELVQDLADVLPMEVAREAPSQKIELSLLQVDRRTIRTQAAVVRPGQASFREAVIARYGGQCCISGCSIAALIEAAHIIPYRGQQTDEVSNGLLLRVDLHRLFDAHLMSIQPEALVVEVAGAIEDPTYRAFHGMQLFKFTPRPRRLFLEEHYRLFQAQETTSLPGRHKH